MDDPLNQPAEPDAPIQDLSRGRLSGRGGGDLGMRLRGRSPLIVVAGLVAVAIAVVVGVAVFNSSDGGSSDSNGAAGSINQKAIAVSVTALRACAQQTTTDPSGCPQRSQLVADAGRWELHGDPAHGARVTGGGASLVVHGHAVMIFTVTGGGTDYDPIAYAAHVAVQHGDATVESIDPDSSGTPVSYSPDPVLGDANVRSAVRQALAQCAGATTDTQPSDCKVFHNPFFDSAVRFTINGDPTADAQYSFDASYGVARLNGSYRATASLAGPNATSKPLSGGYRALVADDGGEARVLLIN